MTPLSLGSSDARDDFGDDSRDDCRDDSRDFGDDSRDDSRDDSGTSSSLGPRTPSPWELLLEKVPQSPRSSPLGVVPGVVPGVGPWSQVSKHFCYSDQKRKLAILDKSTISSTMQGKVDKSFNFDQES